MTDEEARRKADQARSSILHALTTINDIQAFGYDVAFEIELFARHTVHGASGRYVLQSFKLSKKL